MVPPWLRTVSISSALKSSLRERSGSSLRGLGSERERGEGMSCQFMRVCKASRPAQSFVRPETSI